MNDIDPIKHILVPYNSVATTRCGATTGVIMDNDESDCPDCLMLYADQKLEAGPGHYWQPGDPCDSCGSNMTYLDDGIPTCQTCRRSDADE